MVHVTAKQSIFTPFLTVFIAVFMRDTLPLRSVLAC